MHDFGLSEEAIFPFQAWREHANRTESAYSLSNYLKYYGH